MAEKPDNCNGSAESTGRREFLRRAGFLLAGGAVGGELDLTDLLKPPGGQSDSAAAGMPVLPGVRSELNRINGLPASRLGNTDLVVTRIGFGGIMTTEPNVLLHSLDRGFNFVHTSQGFQGGLSMAAFGRVIKEQRDRVVVAVKEFPRSLDSTLAGLNTDYVDIIMPPLHSPEAVDNPRLVEDFHRARDAGKCRYLGFACHSRMTETLELAAKLGYYDVALVSYMNTDDPFFFRSLRLARTAGMGIVAMKGLPASAYRKPGADAFDLNSTLVGSILNRWYAHSVMASMDSYQAVDMYARILDDRLGWRDEELERRWLAERQQSCCAMCGACSGKCPAGVQVDRVLRYRMYHADYDMPDYARACYSELGCPVNPDVCAACGECEQVCSRGLPLRDMLADAHRRLA